MSAQGLLDQLLRSGRELLESGGAVPGRTGAEARGGFAGLGSLGGLGKLGAGAGAASVLGALLGSKRGRSYGGKALKYGGIAALGLMAYKAYSAWQAQQQAKQSGQQAGQAPQQAAWTPGAGSSATGAATGTGTLPLPEPRTLDRVPAPEAEQHSRAVLLAMIAAAKADGHLDERERDLIENALAGLDDDPDVRRWHEDALRRPLDPAQVAQAATTPEVASEMYLASLLMVDETQFMERAYLDELARQLKLPDGLKAQLEAQALPYVEPTTLKRD